MYKICHICTYMCCESEKFNEKKKFGSHEDHDFKKGHI